MNVDEITQSEYDEFIASSFWPAFRACWRRSKIGFILLTIRSNYVKFRDCEADSLWWFVRSFFKGGNFYFGAAMMLCVCISEFSYLVALREKLDPCSSNLIEPLFWALPALIGTTMLDYILEFKKRPTVSMVSLVSLSILAYLAYSFHVCEPSVNKFYWITLGVVCFAWCIKAHDPRMTNQSLTASSVLPGSTHLSESNLPKSNVRRGGKKIILKREENAK